MATRVGRHSPTGGGSFSRIPCGSAPIFNATERGQRSGNGSVVLADATVTDSSRYYPLQHRQVERLVDVVESARGESRAGEVLVLVPSYDHDRYVGIVPT